MADTIKIGGELESMATGNVVAAASAIKDKVKNKYQGEINAEVDTHLESLDNKTENTEKKEKPKSKYDVLISNNKVSSLAVVKKKIFKPL